MSAGTITVTNGSATVTGNGTSFTTELKVGDFIGVIAGGTPYTLIVASIASNTQLTIGGAFAGPTASSLAWNAVPASLMYAITQQAMNDMGTILRGMILEKANWQGFYTATDDTTIKLPDGTSVTGPGWPAMQKTLSDGIKGKAASGANSDITSLSGLKTALSVPQGGTGVTSINAFLAAAGFANTANSFTVPCNGRDLRLVAASEVVTTNASGEGTISFKQAFPNQCLAVMLTLGDRTGTSVVIINYGVTRTTSFDYHAYQGTGNYSNVPCRINYIAIGY